MGKRRFLNDYKIYEHAENVPWYYQKAKKILLRQKEWDAVKKNGGIRKIFSTIYGEFEYRFKDQKSNWVVIGYKIVDGIKIGYYHERQRGFLLVPYEELEKLKEELEKIEIELVERRIAPRGME